MRPIPSCDRKGAVKPPPTKSARMRAEYDFASMKGGVRGKYAKPFLEGSNLVLLDPDVYAAFPTAEAVNNRTKGLPGDHSGARTKKA
jgi:hypothetical protein